MFLTLGSLLFILFLGLFLTVLTSSRVFAQVGEDGEETEPSAATLKRPIAVFDTNMGVFEVELYNDLAPLTVGNFLKLVNDKFYDGIIFHRVIDDFMIQGGDPRGTGTGGPGYTIPDEFGPGLAHDGPGILSMANAGKNTGGSQFFLTLVPTPWLDYKHAIFGHVVKGMDIVKKIGKVKVDAADRPLEPVAINVITIKN
ncbi:MAG: peptidylprolyl isomerase [Deltaproteobacteria bacterium]|jgi:cyclophilin family peptidyl-prolyl cis-trans isomerase|nr:peptidylprolyl isomerase [Deltaproteobacteria bacterium]